MPSPTYDLIEEKVLGSAQASVTFSSIPGTYKDLVLEVIARTNANDTVDLLRMKVNNDSSALYSRTILYGTGTSAASARLTGYPHMDYEYIVGNNANANSFGLQTFQFMSYANTNVNKTWLSRGNGDASLQVNTTVTLYRSTNAITSIELAMVLGTQFSTNSRFRLWGVSG